MANQIWTFYYGSNMDLEVLKAVDYVPEQVEVARLYGYDIVVAPLANLIRSEQHCVYGILATGTHEELERLYGSYVRDKLGAVYLPEAVICEKQDGSQMPALCYLSPPQDPAPVSEDYLEKLLRPALRFGFPQWYIDKLESFRSTG